MCIPNEVPVFNKDDILIGYKDRFEDGKRATPLGWLQRLFLPEDMITHADVQDYNNAQDELCGVAKVRMRMDLIDWEDKVSAVVAARTLNKCLRNMGYTEIEYE